MYSKVIDKKPFNFELITILNSFNEELHYWRLNPVTWYYVDNDALRKVLDTELLEKAYQELLK